MENSIQLKSMSELSGMQFVIPDYQRGYRWGALQVQQLLEDIYDFYLEEKEAGEFYCLQPIVVRKIENNAYEVIDGQQRLTTIYIILKYLENICKINHEEFVFYNLQYQTRIESESFLKNIASRTDFNKNIDFYFMKEVYETVKKFFDDKKINKADFLRVFLLKKTNKENEDIANNTRFIWYEISDSTSNPIDIFTRLNIGKIPLTNAELIKALLLNSSNFKESELHSSQLRIATEWNQIEQRLQNDSLWYFLYSNSNSKTYDNRIEYIFDLMKVRREGDEYYYTFNEFRKDKEKGNVEAVWQGVKEYFLRLEEWYEDRELYHYIGFLIECNENINNLCQQSEKLKKDAFLSYVKDKIKEKVKDCDIDGLSYSNSRDKDKIRRILLLFNILTIVNTKEAEMRFPFSSYKTENWDIEHINSQTDKEPKNLKEWKDWAEDLLLLFNSNTITEGSEKESFIKKLEEVKNAEKHEEWFKDVKQDINAYIDNNAEEDKDDLSNLALLNASVNRSYGNAVFPVKRMKIIDNDKNGKFIPIATKNVFLKYYSKQVKRMMHWTDEDALAYIKAIKEKLEPYLTLKNKGNE